MRIYFLLFVQVFTACVNSETTLRARINQKSFPFISSAIRTVVKRKVKSLPLPSRTFSIGSGSADVRNLNIESFEAPDIRINSVAPNSLTLSTSGGSVTVGGSWDASYKILFIPIHASGGLSVEISGIKIFLRTNLESDYGQLQLSLEDCQLHIKDVDLQLSGGVAAWLANHFTRGAVNDMKESMQNEVCKNAPDIMRMVNKRLYSSNMQIRLADNTFLSYNLLENPTATSDFIEFDYSAFLTFGSTKCYLQSEGINDQQKTSNHMVVLWIGEPLINCYLKTWYEANDNHVQFTNDTAGGLLRASLNINCTEGKICLEGVSDLQREYTSDAVDLDVYLVKAPILSAENGTYIETKLETDFYQPPKNSRRFKLAQLTSHISSLLKMTVSQRKFHIFTEKITTTTTSEDSSAIGKFDQINSQNFKNVVENALKKLDLWSYTANLPRVNVLPELTLSSNAVFVGRDKYIRADIDFDYTV